MTEPGQRVMLIHTGDPHTALRPGTHGTVRSVDALSTLHVDWEDGSTLGLIPGRDEFAVVGEGDRRVFGLYDPATEFLRMWTERDRPAEVIDSDGEVMGAYFPGGGQPPRFASRGGKPAPRPDTPGGGDDSS